MIIEWEIFLIKYNMPKCTKVLPRRHKGAGAIDNRQLAKGIINWMRNNRN